MLLTIKFVPDELQSDVVAETVQENRKAIPNAVESVPASAGMAVEQGDDRPAPVLAASQAALDRLPISTPQMASQNSDVEAPVASSAAANPTRGAVLPADQPQQSSALNAAAAPTNGASLPFEGDPGNN
jgi:hypothetical protein